MLKMDVSDGGKGSSASWWIYSDPAILGYIAELIFICNGQFEIKGLEYKIENNCIVMFPNITQGTEIVFPWKSDW